jgi:hypothetical protein
MVQAMKYAKRKEWWNGWDLNSTVIFQQVLPLQIGIELSLNRAEVVGSNPTRSISYYEGTTVLN